MDLNELSYKIIGCAYDVHKILGPGLLESTYEKCLCFELEKLGIKYERQKELPINYKGMIIFAVIGVFCIVFSLLKNI